MNAVPEPSPSTAAIPSGTVTFAFTDIEGSTVRWDRDRDAMQDAVRRHDAIMREAIAARNGHVFKTIGDAFCAAFSRPEDAIAALLDAQRALRAADFAAVGGIRVRMAIHSGTTDERDGDYFGPVVNRVARLLSVAHGGQVLVSAATSELVQGSLPRDASLRDLGEHRLKDLAQPERVRQLIAPELAADFPPLRSLNTLANNLPQHVASFVGRETEIAQIGALLKEHRLVTLVGAGGVGKTRTSLQVAANNVDGSGDGVWFVELAPLTSGEYVAPTIAHAVGVTLADGDPVAALVAALKPKNVLLVIDNCEHLVEASALVVSALITVCPQVTILATSRQALGISGEATYRIPSLTLPPPAGARAEASLIPAQEAMSFAAIALFVQRARSLNNDFVLTDENAPIVADICRRLDGIALAIELAAARSRMLSPMQLRDRLDERFRLLTGGGRDRLPRQQTLRALIDWSYDLLDEREQMLFRRLGIFVNGFSLEAAVAIAGAEFDEFEVFDLVASLVEKSLVMAEPQDDALRYHLLESTRAYAAEKLAEAGEGSTIAGRHLRYFRDWMTNVERDAHEFKASRMRAFARELYDIRFALDVAIARGEIGDGAELLAAVGDAWMIGGFQREGIARLEASIAALSSSASLLLSRLATALAWLYVNSGRFQNAGEAAIAAVRWARASGNRLALAFALRWYAAALYYRRDFSGAEVALAEAEAIVGLPPAIQMLLLELRAILSMDTGNLEAAAQSWARLCDLDRSQGNRRNEAASTYFLAEIEFRRGQHRRAAELWHDACAIMRNENEAIGLTDNLLRLGSALAVSGNLGAATAAVIEALMILSHEDPGDVNAAQAVELRAYIEAANGATEHAARLAGYADARLAQSGYVREFVPQAIFDRLSTLLRRHLAQDSLARLRAQGASLTPQAAVALARTAVREGDARDVPPCLTVSRDSSSDAG